MPAKKRKRNSCTKQISIRCTEYQKKQIEHSAKELGIHQKDFIFKCIQDSTARKKRESKKEMHQAACACYVQELINHLRNTQKEDAYVEEVCNKLWDLVN